jgi:hypothetical protein
MATTFFRNMAEQAGAPPNTYTHNVPPSGPATYAGVGVRPATTTTTQPPTTPTTVTTPPTTPPPTTPATPPAGPAAVANGPLPFNQPRNVADPANAPWLRQALEYTQSGPGRQPGLYEGSNPGGLWDDMEEIDNTHSMWAHGLNERTYNQDNGEGTTVRNVRYIPKIGSFLNRLNHEYGGALTSGYQGEPGSEAGGAGGMQHRLDFSKLPKTRFGSAENVMAVNDVNSDKLINPEMVYDDPVYGRITHRANMKGNDWLGPLLMTLATAGMGGIMGAGGAAAAAASRTGMGAVNLARAIGGGGDPLAAIANFGMQFVPGMPTWGRPLTNMAISQLTNNNNRPGGGP